MMPILEYGVSQEDALVDSQGLKIQHGDQLLCISSAGEIPLNLLARHDIHICSIDVLPQQNALTRFKLRAAITLDPIEAARLIGFRKSDPDIRRKLYLKIAEDLPATDREFWHQHPQAIETGPVWGARFEQYISRFNGLGRLLLKKKNLLDLMECTTIAEQEDFFDRKLSTGVLKGIFKIVFHPRIYKKRGISERGLTHVSESDMATLFYGKFRNFCCSTLARNNYFFQFTFFNEVIHQVAFPEYLSEEGTRNIRTRENQLEINHISIQDQILRNKPSQFNKFHLSNIGDWMSKDEFADLLENIGQASERDGRLLFRYIHYNHPIPDELKNKMIPDYEFGNELSSQDRYPFYGIVPVDLA